MYKTFYTIEGIDGSGKTVAMDIISKKLKELDLPHVMVSAYPKDEDSMRLRNLWISQQLPPDAEAAVILELRRRVLVDTIIPALRQGKIVFSDRFNDSTWVYQHVARGVSPDVLKELIESSQKVLMDLRISKDGRDRFAYKEIAHHHTIHLDVSAQTAVKRIRARGKQDAFERNKEDYFQKLIDGYAWHYRHRRYHGTVTYLDSNQDLDGLTEQLHAYLGKQFGEF